MAAAKDDALPSTLDCREQSALMGAEKAAEYKPLEVPDCGDISITLVWS